MAGPVAAEASCLGTWAPSGLGGRAAGAGGFSSRDQKPLSSRDTFCSSTRAAFQNVGSLTRAHRPAWASEASEAVWLGPRVSPQNHGRGSAPSGQWLGRKPRPVQLSPRPCSRPRSPAPGWGWLCCFPVTSAQAGGFFLRPHCPRPSPQGAQDLPSLRPHSPLPGGAWPARSSARCSRALRAAGPQEALHDPHSPCPCAHLCWVSPLLLWRA